MEYKKIDLGKELPASNAAVYLYLIDYTQKIPISERPMIVICPGGGYAYTSDREAEMIALQFLAMGYHAAVLRYSVAPVVFPAALLELGKTVALLRENAREWGIDSTKIVIAGFSAGGHLALSYGVYWNRPWVAEKLKTDTSILQPNALILGYPVVTSGQHAHQDSMHNLLGDEYDSKKEDMSLEKHIGQQVPRSFVWHTCEDASVPVQNSLLLVNELIKNHIPTEFHMFEKGKHGLALANRLTATADGLSVNAAAAEWIHLVHTWLEEWILQSSDFE